MELTINNISVFRNITFCGDAAKISKETFIEQYNNGLRRKEFFEQYGISPHEYYKNIRESNLPSSYVIKQYNREQKIQELLKQGKTLKEAHKALNLSQSTYYNYLKAHNLSPGKTKSKAWEQQDVIVELIKQRKSMKEIANHLGITIGCLVNIFKSFELKTNHMETINNLKKSQIQELFAKYKQYKIVCEKLGISYHTLKKYVSRFGIKVK